MSMTIFHYEFMQNAFLAGTLSALVSAVFGYFVVLRGQSFAGHALSHIGFAGAAGAGLVGLTPPIGQLLLTLGAAASIGLLGDRAYKSDIAIGIILAFSLGLGVLFLSLYNAYAGQAMTILFGDLLGVSYPLLKLMLIFSIIAILGLIIIARPLLFCTLEPELAEAKGLSLKFISVLFLLLLAIAITETSIVIGVLLVFTLLIGPPAAALRLTQSFWGGIAMSIALGLLNIWLGLIASFITNWPTTFWISSISLAIYLLSLLKRNL